MRYINRETGEIIDITPYRVQLLRETARRDKVVKRRRYLKPARTYRVRLTWSYWFRQLLGNVGPAAIGLVLVWVLLGGVGGGL